ncbi:unnamed protein product [Rotaria sp. Silwood2]|nr:unnamed protein product [Rotaria sp. Silwood2]CAF4581508.1 unnamed protein product [Rotaria sp. Silwood2]
MTFVEIFLPSSTTGSTRTQCISCHRFIYNHSFKRKRINGSLPVPGKLLSPHKIKQIFICKRVLINSKHNYICRSCDLKDLTELYIPTKSITNEQLSPYHEALSYVATAAKNEFFSDFPRTPYDTFNNEQCKLFSGLTKQEIQQLATAYNLNEKKVFLFYTKCNTNNNDRLISEIFRLSHQYFSDCFNQSIEDLYNSLVNDELGTSSWNRKKINIHTPEFAKQLLKVNANDVAVCMDGFFIYIEKSGDFILQKLTWSSQVLRNCMKFHCVTALDGSFIEIQGGYGTSGHNNEETIINSLTNDNYLIDSEDNENNIYHNHITETLFFKKILKDNDILILDRGYRRMKKRHYKIKIPQSINKGKTQLSTKQANESRLVTFHRNVVERAIGRLKKWKFLQNRILHQYVANLHKIVRILASTINKFDGPLYQNSLNKNKYIKVILKHLDDSENELKVLMHENQNHLWKLVAKNHYETIDFVKNANYLPNYTSSDMECISTGYYGMKLSERYLTNSIDHIKIYEHQTVENCIKVTGIVSRFASATKHSSILKFYPAKSEDIKFYCSCKSGARTTNPCAHSLSILVLIQSIQKQLPRLLSTRNVTNYHHAIKFAQRSSHHQEIYNNIIDCKIYKEWSTSNETFCVCNEPYQEGDWMIKCCLCHELYHPSCIDETQKEIEDNIDEWRCPYCREDDH